MNESGKTDSVRGYISGDKVYVRADHPIYTADQIMRHEAGHAKIASGEIDPDTVRERIGRKYGGKHMTALSGLYTAAYEGSGMTCDEIWEEVICDALGDMNIFRAYEVGDVVDILLNEVGESAETEAYSARGPPDNADVPDRMSRRGYWRPDLSYRQLTELRQWVKHDIRTSENSIGDTANWTFCRFNGLPVLAIYSTENPDDPTILYESKGAQAEYEKIVLKNMMEEWNDGGSLIKEPEAFDEVFRRSWMWSTGIDRDDAGTVGRGGDTGDVGVLRKPSGCRPSAAYESVIRNLLQVQRKGRTGRYSLEVTPIEGVRDSGKPSAELLRQMEALRAQYRREAEQAELERAFLRGFGEE